MTVIKIKSSTVAGKTPAPGDLQTAELAVNLVDQKLYSKDASGNIFEIGVAGDVPSGGTPPSSNNNVGDLFYDTTLNELLYWNGSEWVEVGGGSEVLISDTPPPAADLQEGTLWWNSSEDDLQLYVLYNNGTVGAPIYNWIEASPMPGAPIGYPDLDFENGETLDDYFVKKSGDDMTGNLTIATDKIELKTDGSIISSNFITADYGFLTTNKAYGGNFSVNIAGSSQDCFNATIASSPVVSIGWDGSITAAGQVTANRAFFSQPDDGYSGMYVYGDNTSETEAFIVRPAGNQPVSAQIDFDGSATFAGSITAAGYVESDLFSVSRSSVQSKNNYYSKLDTADTGKHFIAVDAGANTVASINADGSASFAETVISGDSTYAGPYSYMGYSGIGVMANSSTPKATIFADGSATFAGESVIGDFYNAGGVRFLPSGETWVRNDNGSSPAFQVSSGSTDQSNVTITMLANGTASFAGTVTATVVPPSDARFKENITPAKPQLADVVALGGILKNYDWNDDAPLNEQIRSQRQLGLIAQEAAEICPSIVKDIHRTKTVEVKPAVVGPLGKVREEAVTQEVDDSYKGISQDALVMKLIGAVTELAARNEALETRISELEEGNAA